MRGLHAGRTGKEGEETGGDAPRFTPGFLFLRTPAPVSLRERGEMECDGQFFFNRNYLRLDIRNTKFQESMMKLLA